MNFNDKYLGETLRALSWKQPYASLMLHGKVETRTWDAKYRGLVLICASKAPYTFSKVWDISGEDQINRMRETLCGDIIKNQVTGVAIAIGRLCASRQMDCNDGLLINKFAEKPVSKKTIEDACFVNFNPELYMHIYRDVQPIVPFEWHGVQGWKTVDEETKSKIILL